MVRVQVGERKAVPGSTLDGLFYFLRPSVRATSTTSTTRGAAVGLATAAYGVSFGALSVAAGLDIWQTCFISLIMFSGGSQFALVGVLAAVAVAVAAAVVAAALFAVRVPFIVVVIAAALVAAVIRALT